MSDDGTDVTAENIHVHVARFIMLGVNIEAFTSTRPEFATLAKQARAWNDHIIGDIANG